MSNPIRAEAERLATAAALEDLAAFARALAQWACPRCGETVRAWRRPMCPRGCNELLQQVTATNTAPAEAPERWLARRLGLVHAALQTHLATFPDFDPPASAPDDDIRLDCGCRWRRQQDCTRTLVDACAEHLAMFQKTAGSAPAPAPASAPENPSAFDTLPDDFETG